MFRLSALHDIAYLMNDTGRCSMTKQIKKSKICYFACYHFAVCVAKNVNVLCILNDCELSYALFES